MPTGKIIFFNKKTGFDFIKDNMDGKDHYVKEKSLVDDVQENDEVAFELKNAGRGTESIKVKKLIKD